MLQWTLCSSLYVAIVRNYLKKGKKGCPHRVWLSNKYVFIFFLVVCICCLHVHNLYSSGKPQIPGEPIFSLVLPCVIITPHLWMAAVGILLFIFLDCFGLAFPYNMSQSITPVSFMPFFTVDPGWWRNLPNESFIYLKKKKTDRENWKLLLVYRQPYLMHF